jgi:ABC-2 type transport system permease protein
VSEAAFKLTWVELKLVQREPLIVLFALAFPLVVLLVLAGVFDPEPDPDFRGVGGIEYYVPAYLGVVVGAVGLIGLPVHIAGYRERGVMRRFRASSVAPWTVVAAQLVVGFVLCAVGALLLVAVAALVYDVGAPESPAGVVLAFVVGTVSFLAIGVLLASLVRTARAAQALGLLLFFPMWLLSGAGPPRAIMPAGMRAIGDVLPLTQVVTAVQDPWIGLGTNAGVLALLAAIGVVAATLAAWRLRSG